MDKLKTETYKGKTIVFEKNNGFVGYMIPSMNRGGGGFETKKRALESAKKTIDYVVPIEKNYDITTMKGLAELAADDWAEERNFGKQYEYAVMAEKLGTVDEYFSALDDLNAFSLVDWLETEVYE